jgi:hypothetical protein
MDRRGGKRQDLTPFCTTEIKFNANDKGSDSNIRKLLRKVLPAEKAEAAIKVFRGGQTVSQLYNDMLDSDINLKGKGIPGGGVSLSEKEGEASISWQLWSDKKDQKVLNLTTIKNSAQNSEIRKEAAETLHKAMSVQ